MPAEAPEHAACRQLAEGENVAIWRAQQRHLSDPERHERQNHPDWEYETTEGRRKAWDDQNTPPPGVGWIRNTYRAGGEGWERFDHTEESYWMRPRRRDVAYPPVMPGWQCEYRLLEVRDTDPDPDAGEMGRQARYEWIHKPEEAAR